MKILVDTNILISAILWPNSKPNLPTFINPGFPDGFLSPLEVPEKN